MAYTTQTKVEKYANIDLSSVSDQITFWVNAVKLYIDAYCGRTFESNNQTRYYDGQGGVCLLVDPFIGNVTIEFLNLDGTTARTLTQGQANDFILYPLNRDEKYEIRLVPGSGAGNFPYGPSTVKITGDFSGASAVPDDISLAATMMVAEIAKGRSGGDAQSESLGDYSITYVDVTKTADLVGANKILDLHTDIAI